jgi:hypothetical protein
MSLVVLNSRDRDLSADSSTSFSITCERLATDGAKTYEEGAQLTLHSAAFPDTLYNVNSYNDAIVYTSSAGVRTVELTQGRYTMGTLATHVAAVMTADLVAGIGAGNSLAVSYDSTTLKYTFTPTLTAGTFQFNPVSQAGFTALEVLGYKSGDDADPVAVATATPTTAPYAALLGYEAVYLWCSVDGVRSYNTHRKAWGSQLGVMHPTGTTGDLVIWEATYHDGFRIPGLWTKVQFELRDHQDRLLDLNGADINITLHISGLVGGLPKRGYYRPSVKKEEVMDARSPWALKPLLPSVYNNPSYPAGNDGDVLDPGYFRGGPQAYRQSEPPQSAANKYGANPGAKRNR